ncbi:MAG TPA: ATPase domain-containing protein [Candidatus Acidoferrales bacterium]|nr:ATPase domain-containing protein [Candidatus Acidoferrales bacterium]
MRASTSHAAVLRLTDLALPGRVYLGSAAPELPRRLPSGIAAIDTLLGGGWPQGRISELTGPPSSGKTTLALALLSAASRRGEVVACVDLADALHPASVAAAGADLRSVLWVRPPSPRDGMRCTELILQAGGFAVVVLDLGHEPLRRLRLHTWPRLLYAAEQSHTALVVVAPQPVAGSCAAISLRMQPQRVHWQHGLWPLLDGFESVARVDRSKLGRPGQRVMLQLQSSPPRGLRAWGHEGLGQTTEPEEPVLQIGGASPSSPRAPTSPSPSYALRLSLRS